jgi:RNA polymerase sigma-70 factor (ECF subfamily)
MKFMKDDFAARASISLFHPLIHESGEAAMDEQAFHLFYGQTAKPLRAYVARVLGNETHADDIVQESYLRRPRTPLRTDDTRQVRACLFRIAGNLIVDHWRSRKHEVTTPDDYVLEASADPANVGLRVDMARTFSKLKPQERQLVWLAYVEGSDHREIAAALGVGQRSVRVLLHRAKQKLARLIKDENRSKK